MGLIRKLKEKFRKKRKEVKEEIKVAVKEELTEVKKDLKSYFDHNKDGIPILQFLHYHLHLKSL